jgi:L-serine deaminase
MISAFDLFKIGIGPSSSHTVGPMLAAHRFRDRVRGLGQVARIRAEIFGSLAWTGRGHGTVVAIFLGLLGTSHPGSIPTTSRVTSPTCVGRVGSGSADRPSIRRPT